MQPDFEADHVVQRFFLTLVQTQRQPAAAIRAYQHQLLEKLVRHARACVPFYRDSGRLDCLFDAADAFRIEAWPDVPVLTRGEAHRNQEALVARQVPVEMRPVIDDTTSGTTGEPLTIRRTALSRVASRALLGRAFAWHNRADVGNIAITATSLSDAAPSGPSGGRASTTFKVPVRAPRDEQLAILRAGNPTHLVGYPNQMLEWLAGGERDAFAGVRCVVSSGEVLTTEARQALSAGFNAPVIDAYSTSETGPIAFTSTTGGFRIAEENVFVEDAAERDEAVLMAGDGALQPVTVTPFYAYATPLIRYRPGDYIEALRPGRGQMPGLRRLGRVVGRERNLLVRRDGSRFWPNVAGKLMSPILHYEAWQVVQEKPGEAVMSIVVAPDTPAEKLEALRAVLVAQVFGFDMQLAVRPVASIDTGLHRGKAFPSVLSTVE